MRWHGTVVTATLLLSLAALEPSAEAQFVNRWAVTESYDPASPEVPATGASDIVVVNTFRFGGGGTQWSDTELGLTASDNINAFSDGSDFYPIPGPVAGFPPGTCRFVYVEHTVDPATRGASGSAIDDESSGNGADSDTFGVTFTGTGLGMVELSTDALAVTPGATDLDALAWRERKRYPVYFSLDAASAAAHGFLAADVLTSSGGGAAPTVFRSAASLGLGPTDDIDAVSVDRVGNIVFSVSRSSPAVLFGGSLAALGPAGLAVAPVSGGPVAAWATAAQIGLDPLTDNLNGVRISDPASIPCMDGSQINPSTLFPHDTLLVDNYAGNAPHIAEVQVNQQFDLCINPLDPNAILFLYGVPGRPCVADEFPLGFDCLSFLPGQPGTQLVLVGVGFQWFQNLVSPQPLEVTLQAIMGVPGTGQKSTSNTLTLLID